MTKCAHLDGDSLACFIYSRGPVPFLAFTCGNLIISTLSLNCSAAVPTAAGALFLGADGEARAPSGMHVGRTPGAAKEVSATTGAAGGVPERLAALPVNGAFVKGGAEDT